MSQVAISVDHVSKRFRVPLDRPTGLQHRLTHPVSTSRYRELNALQDVNFQVPPGEFVGITGPNGCGKTTLLKVLSRIYEPDGGRVSIKGRVSPFIELGVGFKDELTARENIYLAGSLQGLTKSLLAQRVEDVLEFSELAGFADQKLKNFSSGMVVRLAFSVAMLADADILLMDEVLAVGDPHFQEKCFDVFSYYKRSHRTIILVTHDLAALEVHCDRVLLMERGCVIADGAPNEVVADYRRRVAAQSEAEEPGSAQTLLAPANRWGSGEVEITDVRLLDSVGHRRHSFASGDHVTIAVDYVVKQEVPDFVCGLVIRRFDGLSLAMPSTNPARYQLAAGPVGTCGTVTYDIPALRLLAAHCLVSVGCYDSSSNRAYDHLEDVLPFSVTDDLGRLGVVDLDGSWGHTVRPALSAREAAAG